MSTLRKRPPSLKITHQSESGWSVIVTHADGSKHETIRFPRPHLARQCAEANRRRKDIRSAIVIHWGEEGPAVDEDGILVIWEPAAEGDPLGA